MPTFTTPAQNITATLKRLREARVDGDPDHTPEKCSGACFICTLHRQLDRQLDKIPRREASDHPPTPTTSAAGP